LCVCCFSLFLSLSLFLSFTHPPTPPPARTPTPASTTPHNRLRLSGLSICTSTFSLPAAGQSTPLTLVIFLETWRWPASPFSRIISRSIMDASWSGILLWCVGVWLSWISFSLVLSLIHSLTHSFTHSFTHSLTHSFTYSLINSFTHSHTHTLTRD